MTNVEMFAVNIFVIPVSSLVRHSSFVIRHFG